MKVPEPRKLPSGNWFCQLRLGGESIPITAATEKECRRQAQLIKAEHMAGKRAVQRSDLTLRQACEQYIAKKEKAQRSPETIRGYDIIMRNRFQDVMDLPVSARTDWQKAYNADAAHLSPKTMENTWRFIRSACREVCGIDLPDVTTLTPKRTEHLFLEPEEIRIFVAEAAKDKKYAIPLMLCLLSCRSSEVQGLSWDDVDLRGGRIHISGAMVQNKAREYVYKDENKTDESSRYIPILIPQLRDALDAVPGKSGKVVKERPNSVYRRANQICERLGLPQVGQHGLRHSYASLCFFLNVPVKATCATGGWKNDKIVTEIYTHLSKKYIDSQLSKMMAFFQNANGVTNDQEETAWLSDSWDA